MLKYITNTNMFDIKSDIYINPINCVGTMGKGLALEFRNRYPEMFNDYKIACNNKKIDIGNLWIWRNSDICIIGFPTKYHWKNQSKYEYIEVGLKSLKIFLLNQPDDIIVSVPAIGCGCGGLEWNIVVELIEKYLSTSTQTINIHVPF